MKSTLTTPSGLKVIEVIAYGITDHPSGAGRLAAVLVEQPDGTRVVEVLPMHSLKTVSKVVERVNEIFDHRGDRVRVHYWNNTNDKPLCGIQGKRNRAAGDGNGNGKIPPCRVCDVLIDLYEDLGD